MGSKQRFTVNLILLGIAILWPLFQAIYFSGTDAAGRIKILITLTAIVVNGKYLFQCPKAMHLWLLWVVYSAVNTYVKGFFSLGASFPYFVHHSLLMPYIMMLVAYQAVAYNVTKTTRLLFWLFLVYTLVGASDLTTIIFSDSSERLSNELGNTYFNTIVLLMTFSSLMYVSKKLNIAVYVLIFVFLSYISIISGERKGLIALFIIVIGSYISVSGGMSLRSVLSYMLLAVLAYGSIIYVMENTTFGERMTHSIENTQFEGNWFLTLMGDRGPQYYEGWFLFLQHPWTGIGLHKFAEINTFWYGGTFHTEYMVQLTECGIVGSLMFVFFYYGMLKGLFGKKSKHQDYATKTILRATLIAIMVINLVAWSYSNVVYFIIYGYIYAFCFSGQEVTRRKAINYQNPKYHYYNEDNAHRSRIRWRG